MIRIKQLREAMSWTQGQLAEKIGSSTANVSKYEKEQVEPNITTLKRLSDLFNVSIDYILGLTDNPHKPDTYNASPVMSAEERDTDFAYIMGADGTRKKYYVPKDKAERFKKLIEAGLPEMLDE